MKSKEQLLPHLAETGQDLQAYTFLLAANETTASTLSFCLYNLAANPAKQDAARKEIHAQGPDFTPSPENLDQLPYLHAVLRWAHCSLECNGAGSFGKRNYTSQMVCHLRSLGHAT